MAVATRQELIDYCLRKLGAPMLQINVDEEQLSDRLDEAIEYYREYHSDATTPTYIKYVLTQEDIDNRYIPIPDNITHVDRIFPLRQSNSSTIDGALFDWQYHTFLNDQFLTTGGIAGGGLTGPGNISYYEQTMQHLELIRDRFGKANTIRFNRHVNRLYIDVDWSKFSAGDLVIIDAQSIVDEEVYSDVFNDHYLKLYLTQLIKSQWAQNMSKFQGMTLPGGAQVDAQRMMDEALTEIEKLREEMRLTWEEPVGFLIG